MFFRPMFLARFPSDKYIDGISAKSRIKRATPNTAKTAGRIIFLSSDSVGSMLPCNFMFAVKVKDTH